jgi:hypothetical protein
MDRKGDNGRYLPSFKAAVVEDVKGGEAIGDAAMRWGVEPRIVRRWCGESGVVETPRGKNNAAPPSSPRSRSFTGQRLTSGKARAPVEDMGEEDRTRAVSTVRTLSEVLEMSAVMMLAQVKRAQSLLSQKASLSSDERAELHGILSLDVKTAAAMHNISRTNGNLIDTHPGLMKLAGIKERTGDGDRKLDAVAAALGLTVGDT